MNEAIDVIRDVTAVVPLEIVGPILGGLALLLARQYLGRWPDLWRWRRLLLPILGQFDDHPKVPDKTEMVLRDEEFAGVVNATPAEVRQHFRDAPMWWAAPFASIQKEVTEDGTKHYEVGSYAYREDGFLGKWQVHVRLTPRDDGRKTALWAHYELSPIASPKKHYNAVGWNAARGVAHVVEHFEDSEFDLDVADA